MPVVDLKFSNRACVHINRRHAILEFAYAVFRWFIVFDELQLVKDLRIIYNNPRSSIWRISAVTIRNNEKEKKTVEKIHFSRKVCASIRVGVEVFDPNCQITSFLLFRVRVQRMYVHTCIITLQKWNFTLYYTIEQKLCALIALVNFYFPFFFHRKREETYKWQPTIGQKNRSKGIVFVVRNEIATPVAWKFGKRAGARYGSKKRNGATSNGFE